MEAAEAALDTLGSMRLLVNVAVPLPVGKPLAVFVLLPMAVTTPVPVVVDAIPVLAPPPINSALAVNVAV